MSQYTHIFLRKGDTFMEISCTSRSCALSEMLEHYAPCEKIRQLTVSDLDSIIEECDKNLGQWHDYLQRINERKALIATFNNSVEDKIAALSDCDESIEEVGETVDELSWATNQFRWIKEIVDDKYRGVTAYAGVECGSDVTVDDIQK